MINIATCAIPEATDFDFTKSACTSKAPNKAEEYIGRNAIKGFISTNFVMKGINKIIKAEAPIIVARIGLTVG